MNIYWNNFIYYGVMISRKQYNYLLSLINDKIDNKQQIIDTHIYSSICIRKYIDKYFLFIFTTYYNFRNTQPMFKDNITQNFIRIDDIKSALKSKNISDIRINNIFHPDKDEKERLGAIISLLEFPDDGLKPQLEMVEIISDNVENNSYIAINILVIK